MTTTPTLTPDPLADGGILGYAAKLRSGQITARAAVRDYLARIDTLDGHLGAYEHVAHEQALAAAEAMDDLLQAGIDLGPLMGVPVGVKDLLAVDGMPTTAGSYADVRDLVGGEGNFVKRMKRAGCIVLGKTRTTEFAMSGGRLTRGRAWNPWDLDVHRAPGGSSSGSGVAVAAGLCGFAIGSDTGGSVRIPAALCGTVGLKTTAGLWPLDGVFPMAPTFDTLGLLTRSAADAAIAYAVLEGEQPSPDVPGAAPLAALRLAKPDTVFFEALDPDVSAAVEEALARLIAAGATVAPQHVPEAAEPAARMAILPPTEMLGLLGTERFLSIRDTIDLEIAERIETGLSVMADDYLQRIWRHRELCVIAAERMRGFDAWVTPTCPLVAPPMSDLDTPESGHRFHARVPRNTRPGNTFGMCAVTLPLMGPETGLPVGLQLMGVGGTERHLLAVSRALEAVLGVLSPPDLDRLATPSRAV